MFKQITLKPQVFKMFMLKAPEYFLFILLLCIISCDTRDSNEDMLINIDLNKAIKSERNIFLSSFAHKIEYVPLENTPECPVQDIRTLTLTQENIIIRSGKDILLFDRFSGKFVRQIGKSGRGPNEYLIPAECFYNKYSRYIYALTAPGIIVYNLKGEIQDVRNLVRNNSQKMKLGSLEGHLGGFLSRDTAILYVNISSGSTGQRLIIINKDSVVREFPHHSKLLPGEIPIDQDPIFFTFRNKISFKERSNDTVFLIKADQIEPRLLLVSGESGYPYILTRAEALEQLNKPKDYLYVLNLFETSDYLFFDVVSKNIPDKLNTERFRLFRNLCIYDKSKEAIFTCMGNYEDSNSCIIDDINNFIPIFPISATDNEELLAVLQPSDIKKWEQDNPSEASRLRKKIPWLGTMTDSDNPVIAVVKLDLK